MTPLKKEARDGQGALCTSNLKTKKDGHSKLCHYKGRRRQGKGRSEGLGRAEARPYTEPLGHDLSRPCNGERYLDLRM